MNKQHKMDSLYLEIVDAVSKMSFAKRKKVGAVIVKDDNIISYGWNGTPAGDENSCEEMVDGVLRTKIGVLHAESNALMKLLRSGSGVSTSGATAYLTMGPCIHCAKMLKQAQITRVVFKEHYRDLEGTAFLEDRGVQIEIFEKD